MLAALLLVYPVMQARYVQAEETPANTLPELGRPNDRPGGTFSASPQGLTFGNSFDGKRFALSPEYNEQTGFGVGGAAAVSLGKIAAGGVVFNVGERKKELLFNAGFQVTDAQRFVLTIGQLRQYLNIGFVSGFEKTEMTQTGGGASYQFRLDRGVFNNAEINAYMADTPSRDLTDLTFAVDSATLYEQWNDPRRVAGGRVIGMQGKLALTPLPGGILKLGAGGEQLEYDYFTGKQSRIRPTGSAEYTQHLPDDFQFKIGADAASAQNRYALGLDRPFGGVGLFGVNLVAIRGRDGAPDDNQIKLTWSHTFDSKRDTSGSHANPAWGNLLDQVAKRPTFIPAQVVAKLDTTAMPTRLIAVNKTALPAGSRVNTATGAITAPLGVAVTGIAGITLNAAPFGNSGQFGLSGNNLVIDPGKITQPAEGATDTYVVTVNNVGGGTTLVTVAVSHGSVRIDSINISNGVTDAIAPTTTAVPSVSGTTDTATTLSATVSENGTGYYLVLPAAATAPTISAVQAGTAFAMTANVAATPAITGLTASTAYKIYFVSKDAANNVQAAVQSVAVTTSAAPDVAAPTTTAAPTVSGTTDTATTLSATVSENGTGYYLVQPAAATVPTVAAVQAGTAFAMTANVAATPAITGLTASTAYKIYFVAKDAANNVQVAVQSVAVTTGAAADVTAPTTTASPAVSGTTATSTTLSATINENGTGYYLVLPAAATAPTVAAVQAGTAFAMTANVAATPAITGLTASTAYKVYFVAKDAANNVQAAVQSVTVTTSAAPDVTAPTTTVAPAVSGTTATSTTLSATVNENGTGYYLVQPAAATAPTVAAVQAGTAFAMTANVAATPAITGLTASTAYKIYFVAKDAANNVQAAVQSVAVTTSAAPDVTAPITTVAPAVSGTTATSTTLSATVNENGTGYYLVQPAAATAPTVAAVQAGTAFAMTANVAATPAITGLTASTAYKIYFVAKDAANNVQAAVQSVAVTTSAALDVTAPTTTVAPAVSGTTATATTLSATVNENGTGYYLVLPAAATAPTVAVVQAGTAFAMTANVAATPAITGLTAATAYKIYFVAKDAANNVQAAVQSVAVTTSAAQDVTAPTTTVAPAVYGTTATATTLSATVNENGTGYYLVLPDAATVPTVAAVQAGTAFAMTANVAATPAITGLTASTAYKIYFVAKDAANNVQGAVQSVAVTTTAADTTPPATPTVGLNGGNDLTNSTTVPLAITGDTDNVGVVGWFVAETSSSHPANPANGTWSSTRPTLFELSSGDGPKTVVVWTKDAAGNISLDGSSTIMLDAPPAAPTGLAINGGAATTDSDIVTLDGLTTPADVDLAGWFVSESVSAPAAGDAGWFSTNPTTYAFANDTNETKTVCVYVKDASGNVQPTGACDTIDKVP